MSSPSPLDTPAAPAPPPRRTFLQRRLRDPILALLTQGVTPDKIAATIAAGSVCSMFPFLGFTTALNVAVGLRFRMNQPIMQTLNALLGPVHLIMILVYVRMGEWLWRDGEDAFSVAELFRSFRDDSLATFFQRFGWAGVHAFTAWLLTAPLLAAAIYYSLRPVLRRLATLRLPRGPRLGLADLERPSATPPPSTPA